MDWKKLSTAAELWLDWNGQILNWCKLAWVQWSSIDSHQLNNWPQGLLNALLQKAGASNTFQMFKYNFTLHALPNTYQYLSIVFPFGFIAKWQSLRGNCSRLLWNVAVIYPKIWKATLEYRTTSGKYVCLLIWSKIKTSQGQEQLILALELLRMIRKHAFFFPLLTTIFLANHGTMPFWYISSRYVPHVKDCGRFLKRRSGRDLWWRIT